MTSDEIERLAKKTLGRTDVTVETELRRLIALLERRIAIQDDTIGFLTVANAHLKTALAAAKAGR
jgi:hypothetical protein